MAIKLSTLTFADEDDIIFGDGIVNEIGFIDTGEGNDIILGLGIDNFGTYNSGRINTGDIV
jgi:hypothetical protein